MSGSDTIEAQMTPSLSEATRLWWKIGILSFGGPAAQIALMHREVVDERNWLSEHQFLSALSFCMLLPGPEAMQLATYTGWRLHGTIGGLIAGLLFVIPGALVIMTLAAIYSAFGNVPLVEALLFGLKAAVLVIVVEALFRVSKKALSQRQHWIIAGSAFVGIFFLALPYPLIVLAAGFYGLLSAPMIKDVIKDVPKDATADVPKEHDAVNMRHMTPRKTVSTIILWLAIWLLPLLALPAFGAPDILEQVATFFSKLAVVTFGGAYAVLAYMAQDVVVQFGWLSADEMIDALGLAETTPGPLILVTQFVGFMAGSQEGGIALGVTAAMVTLWVTFAPCFLWIFAGAPYIEWISNQPRLQGALKAITAAVVGVILNLSLWFALHVLFASVERKHWGPVTLWRPDPASIDWLALLLFGLSAFLAFRLHWGIIRILLTACTLGAALRFLL